ncbi:MAG: hypothetical protein L3K25_12490 [Gammaproteobacteria bacterium]|nr:hypothetical protein [Gammaproteobacteria bacterium]
MKPVIQQEIAGCAIASTAALASVSYTAAKKAAKNLGITAADPTLWSDTAPIRQLLRHYRIKADKHETPFTDWQSLPDRALLAIKWHLEKDTPYWHWAVFVRDADGEYVLDSKKALKQNVRTDFGRIKPKWFIGVK